MDDRSPFHPMTAPTAQRPLLGMTILVVEDSRFACEALRLMCLRSGARIRHADCLASARRHLQIYRPTVAIIDLGLPDGSGIDLIKELAQAAPRVDVILGMSGDDFADTAVDAAGADGFLAKPIASLAGFQQAILRHLPPERRPTGPRIVNDERISPDPVAYRDDLVHAADALQEDSEENTIDYVTQFLGGIARSAQDTSLLHVVEAISRARRAGEMPISEVARLNGMVRDRIAQTAAI
ncbi:response regulator [Shimia abyssi]|uniref:Response regulator receiver domain-containing protein n=1 Tax=Shimia abyssi TaxID=1662395 RepID=A0A2P8FJR9_9RHOB|nr:response regulator [Shimia abyssi]PSL21948.1 response regulator receiver domain-containing protein [Shimia abyssi]